MTDDIEARRARALEGVARLADDRAEQLVADRLRNLLDRPGTWLAAPDLPMTAILGIGPESAATTPDPVTRAVDPPVPVIAKRPGRPRLRWALGVGGIIAGAAAAAVLAVAVLVPDQETTEFRLRAAAPGDRATATVAAVSMDAGWHLTVYIDGLPPAPPGTYYQGWLISNGIPVPMGTFHLREAGAVEWWSGVRLTEKSTVLVTRQRLGGTQEPDVILLTGVIPPF